MTSGGPWSNSFPPSFDVGTPNGGHIHMDASGMKLYGPDGITVEMQFDSATGNVTFGPVNGRRLQVSNPYGGGTPYLTEIDAYSGHANEQAPGHLLWNILNPAAANRQSIVTLIGYDLDGLADNGYLQLQGRAGDGSSVSSALLSGHNVALNGTNVNLNGATNVSGLLSALQGALVTPVNSTSIGEIVRGVASQSSDLTQWQDSGSSVLALVTSAGKIKSGGLAVHLGESGSTSATILSGSSSSGNVNVTFGTAFPSAPRVTCQVRSGSGNAINSTVLVTTTSTTGFTFQWHTPANLGANTTVSIDWIAAIT